ncbi:hypothetical protein M3M38_07360 [Fructilactobacillus cliffordii]|nr:hypothetical protein [Fructilactobacillus cliffordii]USS86477.1 hypothetical protein M3M38_07360 [Fructilactobacillus cliffordii]
MIDVKGRKITTDASLRMTLFEYQYKVPITIARMNYKAKTFEEEEF